MTIRMVLNTKGRDVLTIDMRATITEALRMMQEHAVGALLAQGADGGHVGLISERDVICALAQYGAAVLEAAVETHMTAELQNVTLQTSVEKAMEIMTKHRVRHLPVITAKTLHGIVSIGDLVNYRISQTEREAQALKAYIASG